MNAKTEQKERSHAGILQSAARIVRERGLAGASVADVMRGAGLTVGGFYAHFSSKERLVDEIIRRTTDQLRGRLFAGLDDKPAAERTLVVLKRYLSSRHRDDVEGGCSLPAVVGEIASTQAEHRPVLEAQLELFVRELTQQTSSAGSGVDAADARLLAVGLLALMFGGLSLSRATRGGPMSDEMLRACRAVGRWAIAAAGTRK